MCVIIVARDQRANPITPTDIREAIKSNPHGCGLAARYADERIDVTKCWSEKFALEWLEAHADAEDIIFHARIATSGEIDLLNCHPFAAHADNEERWLFHNGVMSGIPMPNPKYCDTWHLAQTLRRYRTTDTFCDWLEKFAKDEHSKFVLLTPQEVLIFNENAGVWRNGKWYSNYSAFPVTRSQPTSAWLPTHKCMTCDLATSDPARFHKDHIVQKLSRRERRAYRKDALRKAIQKPIKATSGEVSPHGDSAVSFYGDDTITPDTFAEWCQEIETKRASVRDDDDLNVPGYRCG